MIMKGLFFLTCILEAVLQIILIAEMKQKKDFKYWNMFLGTTFAIFISDFIAYFSYTGNDRGLSDGLLSIIVCGIPFILSLILLIIGVVVRGTIKDMEYHQEIILKDGRACTLRSGTPQDAPGVLANFILTHEQTDYLSTYPDEVTFTLEQEVAYLKKRRKAPTRSPFWRLWTEKWWAPPAWTAWAVMIR